MRRARPARAVTFMAVNLIIFTANIISTKTSGHSQDSVWFSLCTISLDGIQLNLGLAKYILKASPWKIPSSNMFQEGCLYALGDLHSF